MSPPATSTGPAVAGRDRSPIAVSSRLSAWRWPLLASAIFLLAHLPFLAPTLDDIDAVNFAFGVRDFDPARHHPHPPGYPVYVALGKLSTTALRAVRTPGPVTLTLVRDDAALALALWSCLFGALGLLAWYLLFLELEALTGTPDSWRSAPVRGSPSSIAGWAAVLTAVAPLTWFSAARPMSDIPGLVAAAGAQAALLVAWRRERTTGREGSPAGSERRFQAMNPWLLVGALVAALALGIRSQAAWLTLPLLGAVLVARLRRGGFLSVLPAVAVYSLGILSWAVPMIVATGGWSRYMAALRAQGAEDFSGVDMLWTHPGVRRLAVGLVQTFVLPWSSVPLAAVVLLLALAGLWQLRRAPVALAALALIALPYALFHTLFQETVTTRYALPLLPATCYLAVGAIRATTRRVMVAIPAVLVAWCLVLSVGAVVGYSSAPAPIFGAFSEMQARGEAGRTQGAVLGMHRRIATESRPAFEWAAISPWSRRIASPRHTEWLEARTALVREPGTPVWFLAEPARTGELLYRDLSLVDPAARRLVRRYRWGFSAAGLVDGARPDTMDLYEIRNPGWIAGDGWSLTPETAGLASRARLGPSYAPIEALVRRRPGEALLVIGGRHLGTSADGRARVGLRIDGRPLAEFVVSVEPRFFAKTVAVPAGSLSGPGAFASLTVRASADDGSSRIVPVAIEQFDIQDAASITWAFDEGWQEPEYNPQRQLMWRWMSERAALWIHAGDSPAISIRVTAESPRKYFDRAPALRLSVGGKELTKATPEAAWPRLAARVVGGRPFSMEAVVTRDQLARASYRVMFESDEFFVPASAGQTGDRRHLSARVFEVIVKPAR